MTTTDTTARDERVMRARANKAGKLTLVLERHGAGYLDARALPPTARRIAEELAGVPESSDATWELVAQFLAARATVPQDPFGPLDACRTETAPGTWEAPGAVVGGEPS